MFDATEQVAPPKYLLYIAKDRHYIILIEQ